MQVHYKSDWYVCPNQETLVATTKHCVLITFLKMSKSKLELSSNRMPTVYYGIISKKKIYIPVSYVSAVEAWSAELWRESVPFPCVTVLVNVI